jgi:hypothetical protein
VEYCNELNDIYNNVAVPQSYPQLAWLKVEREFSTSEKVRLHVQKVNTFFEFFDYDDGTF